MCRIAPSTALVADALLIACAPGAHKPQRARDEQVRLHPTLYPTLLFIYLSVSFLLINVRSSIYAIFLSSFSLSLPFFLELQRMAQLPLTHKHTQREREREREREIYCEENYRNRVGTKRTESPTYEVCTKGGYAIIQMNEHQSVSSPRVMTIQKCSRLGETR